MDEQYKFWHRNITMAYRNKSTGATQYFHGPLRYVAVEQPLIPTVWNLFPYNYSDIVTMIPMRHPLGRLLAGDGRMVSTMNVTVGNYRQWAHMSFNDNYALRWLSGNTRNPVDEKTYELALERLKFFKHVLVTDAFDDSCQFLCDYMPNCTPPKSNKEYLHSLSYRDRFLDDQLLNETINRLYWDFKLYDAAVQIAKE